MELAFESISWTPLLFSNLIDSDSDDDEDEWGDEKVEWYEELVPYTLLLPNSSSELLCCFVLSIVHGALIILFKHEKNIMKKKVSSPYLNDAYDY